MPHSILITSTKQKQWSIHSTLLPWNTICGKILVGEELANLVNREPFAKNFLANIQIYTENVYDICNDGSLSTKFFLANSFYLYGSPKFSPTKYSPMYGTVFMYICTYVHTYRRLLVLHICILSQCGSVPFHFAVPFTVSTHVRVMSPTTWWPSTQLYVATSPITGCV